MKKGIRALALILSAVTAFSQIRVEAFANDSPFFRQTEVSNIEDVNKAIEELADEAVDVSSDSKNSLMVISDKEITDFYDALKCVRYENFYYLEYSSNRVCSNAYSKFEKAGLIVEYNEISEFVTQLEEMSKATESAEPESKAKSEAESNAESNAKSVTEEATKEAETKSESETKIEAEIIDKTETVEETEEVTKSDVSDNETEQTKDNTEDNTEDEAGEVKVIKDNDVVVAVIDTGADTYNEKLKGRLVEYDNGFFVPYNKITSHKDSDGHGTQISQIILETAGEGTYIYPINVFDNKGNTSVASVYLAIEDAIAKKVNVINLSITGLGKSDLIEKAIKDAKDKNIPVIVSAGNGNNDVTNYMPAGIEDAIVIASVNEDKTKADYSNKGTTVDFCAYGDWGEKSGTSVSSAYVAGVAAYMLNQNTKTDVLKVLTDTAVDLGTEGKDDSFGLGFVDINVVKEFVKNLDEKYILKEKEYENLQDYIDAVGATKDNLLFSKLFDKSYNFSEDKLFKFKVEWEGGSGDADWYYIYDGDCSSLSDAFSIHR